MDDKIDHGFCRIFCALLTLVTIISGSLTKDVYADEPSFLSENTQIIEKSLEQSDINVIKASKDTDTLEQLVPDTINLLPVSVYASTTKSANLYADYARAKGVLTCSFHWKIADKDSADAYTEITNRESNSPTDYRVAVRLETWETSNKCTRYVYKNNQNKAIAKASADDVCQFASRHSIDNSTDTKELAVDSLYAAE